MQPIKIVFAITLLCVSIGGSSCNKFLDADLNNSEIVSDDVFKDEINATAALMGMYINMRAGFTGGGSDGLSSLAGLSADELHNVVAYPEYVLYETNQLRENDVKVEQFWINAYRVIYQANDIIESLQGSPIRASVRAQMTGEALFVRALNHFYLLNIFGDVPLVITSNYKVNATLGREKGEVVYTQIIADLKAADSLMANEYPAAERIRPNKAAAAALLSRVYLYTGNWQPAIDAATSVINHSLYVLPNDLLTVFVKESQEVIWQLGSETPNNTLEANFYVVPGSISTSNNVLTERAVNNFENNDARFTNWVGKYVDAGYGAIYYPFRYKEVYNTRGTMEHLVVLRLAEQYLIRAEARAKLNDLPGAIADVDVIRKRAGLPLIADTRPGITQTELLDVIDHENQIEFFAEWGHRWFDLKRHNKANEVLAPVKPDWSPNDQLYPIPLSERGRNPALRNAQNPGY